MILICKWERIGAAFVFKKVAYGSKSGKPNGLLFRVKTRKKKRNHLLVKKGVRRWTLIRRSNGRNSGSVGVSSEKAKDRSLMERPSVVIGCFVPINYTPEMRGIKFSEQL